MDESEIGRQVISRYGNGESPKSIYQNLGKNKKWFFKWLKYYKDGNENWLKSSPGGHILLLKKPVKL